MKNLALLTIFLIFNVFFTNAQTDFEENNEVSTSLNSVENYIQASLYPNPSKGYFSIKVKEYDPYDISIYAINGILVYKQENIQDNHIQVDITDLVSKGFYHVRITQNENAIIKKLVIQ
ncbi:MAG: T9SS type A sorting domain-containing protein [Vicingus serpentipes]|nr:T9SS type A sorting domain-containing protein [Vicingus serpentipes]